jgi:hypothetical protein
MIAFNLPYLRSGALTLPIVAFTLSSNHNYSSKIVKPFFKFANAKAPRLVHLVVQSCIFFIDYILIIIIKAVLVAIASKHAHNDISVFPDPVVLA